MRLAVFDVGGTAIKYALMDGSGEPGDFHDVCDGIALQIHNIQCWLDPERVCLGGGVSRNPRFIEGVREALARSNAELNYPFPVTEIELCRFFNEANLIGACQHFLAMQRERAA